MKALRRSERKWRERRKEPSDVLRGGVGPVAAPSAPSDPSAPTRPSSPPLAAAPPTLSTPSTAAAPAAASSAVAAAAADAAASPPSREVLNRLDPVCPPPPPPSPTPPPWVPTPPPRDPCPQSRVRPSLLRLLRMGRRAGCTYGTPNSGGSCEGTPIGSSNSGCRPLPPAREPPTAPPPPPALLGGGDGSASAKPRAAAAVTSEMMNRSMSGAPQLRRSCPSTDEVNWETTPAMATRPTAFTYCQKKRRNRRLSRSAKQRWH